MLSREQILNLMREKVTHPATPRELIEGAQSSPGRASDIPPAAEVARDDRRARGDQGGRVGLPDKMDLVVGRLQMHAAGFGFVIPDKAGGDAPDVYVSATNIKEAMHGDRVLARIERRTAENRLEGRIIRILERGNSTIVGRFDVDSSGLGFVQPFDRRIVTDVHVPTGQWGAAEPGEMVVVEITTWPTASRGPVGKLSEVLGDINEKGVDTEIIIRKYGIPDVHGEAAIEEALNFGPVSAKDVEGRTDFRQTVTVTIDGEHARDFDDAISIEKLPNGHYWLGVHIADVAHYVTEGSALDQEGYERATSVYFPERAVHMFPSELATGICSLNPRVDRLVQTCLMEVDANGSVVQHEFHDGVINTAARMTYTDVNSILTTKPPELMQKYRNLVPKFELMDQLFHILNGRRKRRGSIDFDLPEAEVIIDDAGKVESDRRGAAQHRAQADRRVHAARERDRCDLRRRARDAVRLSHPRAARRAEGGGVRGVHFRIRVFAGRAAGRGQAEEFSAAARKAPRQARGAAHGVSHAAHDAEGAVRRAQSGTLRPRGRFIHALHVADTPLSRPDRPPDAARASPPGYRHGARRRARGRSSDMARHCSDMERRADDAERELVQWKKVRFMADKVGDEFEGYITGVAAFGLFVQLIEHYVEGLVHVSSMADDYYRFLEKSHSLRGENTQKVYQLGDRVEVQVIRVDMDRRQIDLGLVEILETVRTDERRRGPRTARRGRNRSSAVRRHTGSSGRADASGRRETRRR